MAQLIELLRQMGAAVFDNGYLVRLLAVCTPLLLAAMGLVIARRSGVFFLAAEGVMTFSGMAAYFADALVCRAILAGAEQGSAEYEQLMARGARVGWMVGLLVGMIAGMLLAMLFALFLLRFKTDELLTGVVFNIFALSVSGMCLHLFDREDLLVSSAQVGALPVLSIPSLAQVPVLGGLLGSTGWLTYFSLLVPPAVFYLLNCTDFGLRLRAAEENPAALIGTGWSVQRTQLYGMLFAGGAVSLAGVAIALMPPQPVYTLQPNGAGYLAFAAVWASGGGILKSCVSVLLLGIVDACTDVWQGLSVPSGLISALLYAAALAGLWLHAHNLKRRGKVRLQMQQQIALGEEFPDRKKRWFRGGLRGKRKS